MRRAAIIVLDGLGIGPAHDTDAYGDTGSDTVGNTLRAASSERRFPNLARLGLGNVSQLPGIAPHQAPLAAWGSAQPRSPGKDSTTGHWELTGLILDAPFPTYPNGFPRDVIAGFEQRTGRAVLGNKAASGTAILDELAGEHVRTGSWIVYTSADSVFQVAAHEDVIPVAELYQACQAAREMLTGEHGVSRVIARPFIGGPGAWKRTAGRKDFSVVPPTLTLLDHLEAAGIPRVGVGKVDDLFGHRGIQSVHTATNRAAYDLIEEALVAMDRGLLLANVIEFDQTWGHRNDVPGFLGGLEELDAWIPIVLGRVKVEDLIIFTADHGNDPTTPSTDHSRERVPVLVHGPRVRAVSLGERRTFADIGQTVAEFLGVGPLAAGTSFLAEVWSD